MLLDGLKYVVFAKARHVEAFSPVAAFAVLQEAYWDKNSREQHNPDTQFFVAFEGADRI